ncbi:MAG TPA: copper resistance protein CopC [Pyrinomonadaceae bacterium]
MRKLAECLTLALTFFFCAPAAFAHAHLERSEPKANATLKQSPKTVELWFSEELEPSMNTVAVTDQTGRRVDKNNVTLAEGGKKLEVELEDLASGTYTVDWKVLSTDQHPMKGKFAFTVALAGGSAATAPTTPAGAQQAEQPKQTEQPTPPQTSPAESTQESGSSWAQSVVRWPEYLAMMALLGGFAFRLLVLEPSLRQVHDLDVAERAAVLSSSARRFAQLAWWSIVLLALATLAALVLQTAAVLDAGVSSALSPSSLYRVITQTSYGGPWLLQVVTLVFLAILLLLVGERTDSRGLLWAGLVITAVMMLSPSLTGHARAAAKEYHFTVFSDWLHLVAAGFWLGGLFHLTLTMTRGVSRLKGRERLRVLERAIPLFTRLAVASIIVIALTGIYNSWIHVDRLSALWSTPYGVALSVKIIIFLIMVALGGLNTFVIHPKAKRLLAGEGEATTGEHVKLDRSFYRSVGIEAVLGVAVLLAAAVLVFLQPAREHPAQMTRAETSGSVITQDRR